MGYNTYVTGEFEIQPPLEWAEFKENRFYEGDHRADLRLRVTEEIIDTPEGQLIKRQATHLDMIHRDEYRAYHLLEQVQEAVDSFPGHTWSGRLDCEGEENTDIWRVEILGGVATKVEPVILWPGEKTHAEKAVLALHERKTASDESWYCGVCADHGEITWPCRTVKAVEGLL